MALSPHYPLFRLTLDEPYDFAREPGFIHSLHCHNFREDSLSLKENVWRCPVTGLVFLTPSWLSEDYNAQFEPLASWNARASLWEEARRSLDEIGGSLRSAGLLSSSVADLGSPIDWQGVLSAAIVAKASLMDADTLQWALTSKFTLAEDEGFVLHCNKLTDSIRRHVNWIAIQWDNLQVHIRPSGQLAVYRWPDRAQIGDVAKATLVEEFFLSSPGEMGDKDTYFMFLPIPTNGLLIYHSHSPQRQTSKISSARAGSVKGHLVELPSEERPDSAGNFRLTRAGQVGIALTKTPRAAHVIGFHRLRFPANGTYLEGIFSLPYPPLNNPAQVAANALPTGRGTLTGALMKPDDSAAWAGGGKQARVKGIFSNGSAGIYTPFMLATYVRWSRVMSTRDSTPLLLTNTGGTWDIGGEEATTLDLLQRLEFAESDEGRVEGKAVVYAKSDHLKQILQRGDCTWKIERKDSAEEADEWTTVSGGLARWEDADVEVVFYDAGDDNTLDFGQGTRRRMAYRASLSLSDMWARFAEVHQTLQTAFDGLTIGEAINTVLQASGFAALGGTVPEEMEAIRLPKVPKGENWRHGTQEGEDGGTILRQLLLYPRKQLSQFRLLYDWETAVWSCEKVSKLTGPDSIFWWFTPDQREARGLDSPTGAPEPEFRVEYGDSQNMTFRVYPPEANIIRPFGMEKPGTDAKRVAGPPLENKASLEDKTSRDYLGRACVATPMLAPLADEALIARFGRIVYEAIAHRRLVIKIPASGYEPLLTLGTRCDVRGFDATGELATLFEGWWLRRKTTVIDYLSDSGDIALSMYILDEQWDLPID